MVLRNDLFGTATRVAKTLCCVWWTVRWLGFGLVTTYKSLHYLHTAKVLYVIFIKSRNVIIVFLMVLLHTWMSIIGGIKWKFCWVSWHVVDWMNFFLLSCTSNLWFKSEPNRWTKFIWFWGQDTILATSLCHLLVGVHHSSDGLYFYELWLQLHVQVVPSFHSLLSIVLLYLKDFNTLYQITNGVFLEIIGYQHT